MLASTGQVRRRLSVFLLAASALSLAYNSEDSQAELFPEYPDRPSAMASEKESGHEAVIRFVIEVGSDVPAPTYVLLNDKDGQPGWIRAFRGSDRVYFRERCEIADCARRAVVCGAAIPTIRDISATGQIGLIEFIWDGTTSVVDAVSGCETRQPALPGHFIARFCYSHEANFLGDPGDRDPSGAIPGRLLRPLCVEQPFSLGDDYKEVVFRISDE